MKKTFLIGIDPGTKTGVCLYHKLNRTILECKTMNIILAMQHIKINIIDRYNPDTLLFVLEDARKKKWFGTGKEVAVRAQGAGSVKRDTKIWIEFFEENNVDYKLVEPPKDLTKMPEDRFKRLTGYNHRTSEHARDAAMLVWGY